ncbi:MAG: hypothetical protein LUB61_01745 [Eggerthellaceae bacterium]|nr:hypothetical protein [Eggerthellaceae bacterium]
MNNMEKIDLATWPRAQLFQEFMGMTTSIYEMTARLDVTSLVKHCNENDQSFFINFLYLVLRELNGMPEFRMRLYRGDPWIYDSVDCTFTVHNKWDYSVYRSAEFSGYEAFYASVDEMVEKARSEKSVYPTKAILNRTDTIIFSAIPWIDFESITLPVLTTPLGINDITHNTIPGVGWGKYVEEDGRQKMSVYIKVSEAFVDYKHICDAFHHIQNAVDELEFE